MAHISISRKHKIAAAVLVSILLMSGYAYQSRVARRATLEAVGIDGVNNLGRNFSVSSYYLNLGYQGVVGRGVGGGGLNCCVLLPKKWRPGLKVDIRWTVGDWSDENFEETEVGNYRSIKFIGTYKAIVPVEFYSQAETVYVHFFTGGKVRVVSSHLSPLSPKHPVLLGDAGAVKIATQGILIEDVFTKEEKEKLDREFEKRRAQ